MAVIDVSSLNKMDVISQDAYIIGEIVDVKYDAISWNIEGFKVKCSKEVSSRLDAGSSKSMVIMKPTSFELNDVLLISDVVEGARSYTQADSENISSLSYLINKKVVSADQQPIGTVDSILIDLDNWFVHSFKLKLDKTAYESLGIKKGLLFGKVVSGLLSSHIQTVTENIFLNQTMTQMKETLTVD